MMYAGGNSTDDERNNGDNKGQHNNGVSMYDSDKQTADMQDKQLQSPVVDNDNTNNNKMIKHKEKERETILEYMYLRYIRFDRIEVQASYTGGMIDLNESFVYIKTFCHNHKAWTWNKVWFGLCVCSLI